MWAFAIHDRRTNRLTLSRDRFGIKPLYYARSGDSLVFASEIKGVLAALPGDPRGSTSAVVRLLTWGGLDHDETTLFEDVQAVPAGCHVHVDGRDLTISKERYYDVAERGRDPFSGDLGRGRGVPTPPVGVDPAAPALRRSRRHVSERRSRLEPDRFACCAGARRRLARDLHRRL